MAAAIEKIINPTDGRAIARALVNARSRPAGLAAIIETAREARAYHCLKPYPAYGFRSWKTEDQGPLPRCMPLAKRIVRRGARFLFGKGIEIKCSANTKLEETLRRAWNANNMASRAVAMAENGAIDSGTALKFSWDPDAVPQIRIDTLSIVDQVRFYYHPHDRRRVLLARVQYRYHDAVSGKWLWYREEWTAEEEIHYLPIDAEQLSGTGGSGIGSDDPDTTDRWIVSTRATNPFGVIPITHIQNLDVDSQFGVGDLWELYRVIDDLNLVWWQMKRSNQFDSELNPYFIDVELDDDDLDKPAQPGQPIDLKSTGDGKNGKVVFPDGGNGLRPALMEYAKELRKQIEDAAGSVNVDQGEFTNKGNLTQAVLSQLYQVQIEMVAEKRKSYGTNGIELFLEAMAVGLSRLGEGLNLGVVEKDEDSYNVEIVWPDSFALTEDEKTAIVGRMEEEETAGYITHERAIDRVAQMEGIRDIQALKDELKKEVKEAPSPTENDLQLPPDDQKRPVQKAAGE